MKANKVQDLLHYLDDYFTMGLSHSLVYANNISAMITTCEELGFAINPKKVTKLATTTNFLGIDIDSVAMEAQIDPTHLSETISLLEDIMGHWLATKHSILSLIGKLHFVCCICRPGRAFLHHMIETSTKALHLYHRIKLNQEFHWDIDWWLQYLPTWNGVTLLYELHWLTSMEYQLFTDASNVGFRCYFQGHWCQGKFPAHWLQGWTYEHQLERAVCHHHGASHLGGSVPRQEDPGTLWQCIHHSNHDQGLLKEQVYDGSGPLTGHVWHVE